MKRKASAKAQPKVKAPSLYPWRFRTLVFFIGIAFAGLILRLAWIQVIDPDRLRQEGTCVRCVPPPLRRCAA